MAYWCPDLINFGEAKTACAGCGGQLIEPMTAQENDYYRNFVLYQNGFSLPAERDMWLGADRQTKDTQA